ncbi:MAG: molybdenum ABC transporter ATP-binding protein [Alphaproteobacteria bacterium]|nr:molybdenum ABC transporter ATP-binding protein [Alphaproteobacteria bacterium]
MNGIDAHFRLKRRGFMLDAKFTAPSSGVTGLFGPSGSGKTTLLRMIAGLERPDKGWLTLDGKVWQDDGRFTRAFRRPVGYVFQDARLFAHLSVAGNLRFALRRAGAKEASTQGDEVVAQFGLGPLLERRIDGLSGGERQRVAIARALLSHPRLLLMDEPLASLDRDAKRDILPYLEALVRRADIPVLYVSHDLDEIERFADHLVLMDQGRVLAAGPMAELAADPELLLARDPDAAALLDAEIIGHDAGYQLTACRVGPHTLLLPGTLGMPGAARRLRVRASDVSLSLARAANTSILNILPCRIEALEPLGAGQVLVVLTLAGTKMRLLSRVTTRSRDALALATGVTVQAQIKGMALVEAAS